MKPDVKWANGMEGGFVHGRGEVRDYWKKQFEVTQSHLEPLRFDTDKIGRNIVTANLTVKDLQGNLLVERTIKQIFTIENGQISRFEIADSEPLHLTETLTKAGG